jgi:Rrf2 family protein
MIITQKSQYAVRALFSLACFDGNKPLKIAEIAVNQGIPARFLEVILGQLKQAGFVESRRGVDGGYWLATSPREINVGQIVQAIDGPIVINSNTETLAGSPSSELFVDFWNDAAATLQNYLDTTSLADMVASHEKLQKNYIPNYSI